MRPALSNIGDSGDKNFKKVIYRVGVLVASLGIAFIYRMAIQPASWWKHCIYLGIAGFSCYQIGCYLMDKPILSHLGRTLLPVSSSQLERRWYFVTNLLIVLSIILMFSARESVTAFLNSELPSTFQIREEP